VSAPLIQSTMPAQNDADPTAPGMRSEPSKRNVVFSSCRMAYASRSRSLERFSGSTPLLALMTPPSETRLLAHSGVDSYVWNAPTASPSVNAPTISPPPVTSEAPASVPGVMNAQMSPSSATVVPSGQRPS
jgi:hypothetical protein